MGTCFGGIGLMRAIHKILTAVWVLALLLGTAFPNPLFGAEVNRGAIALLVAKGTDGKVIGTGTGFVVHPEGTMVTNYHVLVDATAVDAVFPDGTRAEVLGVLFLDRTRDFSVLKLSGGPYSTLEIGPSKQLEKFQYTSALGYPSQGTQGEAENLKGNLLQTFGFVLGVHPQAFPDYHFIYTTTPFQPGFSGGPLVNKDNQVIGLATLEGRAINLALPIHYVQPHLEGGHLMTLSALMEQDQSTKEALYFKGNFALYGSGDSSKAIELFERVLKIDPNYVLAHYDLAVAYRGLGDNDKAIAEYEKALSINPNFPEALSNLGGQYFRQGHTDKAIATFKEAVRIYPNFIQALSNLGASLNKQQQFAPALDYLNRALELDPEFGIAWFNLGNAHFGLEHFTEAEKAYNSAVRMGVDFLSLHWKLHDIHLRQGRKEKAIQELMIILEIDPENPEARGKLQDLQRTP